MARWSGFAGGPRPGAPAGPDPSAPARRPVQDAGQEPVDDEPGQTRAEAVLPLDARSLRAAYQDLLGRPPCLAERERWRGEGLPRLVRELLGSLEFWESWVDEQLFYFLLIRNFRPESAGVRELPRELFEARVGAVGALHRIALSPAFDRRNPGADTFATVVMEQLLGIEVQKQARELEIGKGLYDGRPGTFLGRSGSSQADVIRIAVEDARCPRRLLAREHERLCRAEPPARDLGRWTGELRRDPRRFPVIVREWLVSDAWRRRLEGRVPQPNRLFVRSLFVDLYDRLPEEDELRPMAEALDGLGDPGPLRSVLARLLVDGGDVPLPAKDEVRDPTAWIGGLFERLLGRAGTEGELATFARAFADPACRPETVLYALLSHPEYHRY